STPFRIASIEGLNPWFSGVSRAQEAVT
ncbi:MAG: hypothetical protein QOF12_2485, partial [Solirubrobacteraceae bacterium]|nr:hypothetical protein [Solirubrobacteraceae bacterium]